MRPIVLVMTEGPRRFARRKLRDTRGSVDAATALLAHALEVAATAGEVVVCAPAGAGDGLETAAVRWLAQGSGSLAARLCRALQELHAEEAAAGRDRPIVVLGDDCPGLDEEVLDDAVRHLTAGEPSVLGRARDGGFWLLGLSRWNGDLAASLAANVAWSGPRAFETAQALLRRTFERKPAIVAELDDLDAIEDVAGAVRAATRPTLKRALAAVRPGLPPAESDDPLPPPAVGLPAGRLPRPPPRR